ncbi:MAG TPA: ABC transporter permease [Thermoanaerobaculia bacterium]|jgi:ABC-2 type transport system permease protein
MTSLLRIHLLEIKYEFLKLLRLPQYALPTLVFPVFFYLFFGVGMGARSANGVSLATYLIATYGAFGVMGASLFGFGVTVALERGQGWLEVKRTTPMPISAYFAAKLAMAMLFSAVVVLLLFAVGMTLGGVHLTFAQALTMFAILVAGSLPFCALGLMLGYFTTPNSAVPIVNMIYMPMAFLSGLWVPVMALPKPLQSFAAFLPPYHFSQLALKVVGASRGTASSVHVLAMLAATALFLFLAWVGYRRDEGKLYG